MLFMVVRFLLAWDTAYKGLSLPSLVANSIADVTERFAVGPDISIFGGTVNIIDFLVRLKKITDNIKGLSCLMVFVLVRCTLQTHC